MSQYPLSEKSPEKLHAPSGRAFSAITLDAAIAGELTMDDLRVTPEALLLQAEVAESAGRPHLAANLRRAAELATVPESVILEVYDALRPGRTSRERLLKVAARLESEFSAPRCAALVREAADGS